LAAVSSHTSNASLRSVSWFLLALLITTGAVVVTWKLPAPEAVGIATEMQLTHNNAAHLDPVFSPDGRYIVFSSNQSGSFDIWLITIDGGQDIRLTSLKGDERFPEFGSNGGTISFVWKHEPFSDLCLLKTANGNVKCVTDKAHVGDYAWSGDGRTIAYDDMIEGDVHLYDTVKDEDSIFPFNATVKQPDFGIGLDILYFAAKGGEGFDIWSANIDGSNPRRLSWLDSDARPQVSPRGDRVVYLTNYSGRDEPWLVNVDGESNQYLFPIYANYRKDPSLVSSQFPPPPPLAPRTILRWSPNGTQILMISSQNRAEGTLFLVTLDFPVNLQGRQYSLNIFNRVPLKISVLDVQWSPDGKNAVVVSEDSGYAQLFLVQIGRATPIGYGK
jgi:Tol biopolymer transport system component